MGKKIKVGVFGGYRGHTMIDVLLDHPDAELVAVCDKYQPILDKIKKETENKGMSVAMFNNFDDFIKYDLDAVVLANYANEHGTYAVRCLNAGLHVLSEVLPCETMAQAVELIEAVERSGKVYAYAENYCYMNSTFEMWKRYEEGAIGKVSYAEGEYIHDCSEIWPEITYGERNHWRNRLLPTFYCTHSLGPVMTVTGLRPVRVVGYEIPPVPSFAGVGVVRGAGLEMVTLEGGAVARSIHGDMKREPSSVNYMFYGDKGMMESGRSFVPGKENGDPADNNAMNLYREGDKFCKGTWERYNPESTIEQDMRKKFSGHGGSDFYATHFFIEKILGNPVAEKYSIDVYRAIDMGICGILAYRSILGGNIPIEVPNLKNPEERDAWRNDNKSTNPDISKGDDLLPLSSFPAPELPDELFDYVRDLWKNEKKAEHPYPYAKGIK